MGDSILPPAGVPESSQGATRKDGTQRHFLNDIVPLELLNDGNDRPSGTCLSDMILDENKLETDSANNDTILGIKPISLPESVENLVPPNQESDSTESNLSVVRRVGELHIQTVWGDGLVVGYMLPPPPMSLYPALPNEPTPRFSPDLVAWCMQTLDRFRTKVGHSEMEVDDGSKPLDKSRGTTPTNPALLGKHKRGTPSSEFSQLSPKRGRPSKFFRPWTPISHCQVHFPRRGDRPGEGPPGRQVPRKFLKWDTILKHLHAK